MEPNRIWHDPVVEIFSNLITPTVCYSAEAYDLANRRWYRLDVTEAEVPSDDWLSSTVADHIRAYYTTHKTAPPWNTISMPARSGPATFSTRPDDRVSRPIRQSLSYGAALTTKDKLPTTMVDELERLTYISRAADRCVWRGRDCVFKRIEFDVDIKGMAREIRAREALIEAMGSSLGEGVDVGLEMTRQFLVTPILAVVLAERKPWKVGSVAGVLMPYCGEDLEMLVRDPQARLPITASQLWNLVRGVKWLGECGVVHGDIRYWNTVLQPSERDGESRLVLIDLGNVAPEYDGDAKALGRLLLWCLDHSRDLRDDSGARAKVIAAAAALLAEEDFGTALTCLDGDDN
jgi:hypothetical protein